MLSPEGVPIGTELWSNKVPDPKLYPRFYQYLQKRKKKMTMTEDLEKQVEDTEAFEALKKAKEQGGELSGEAFIQNPEILGTEEE